MCVCEQNEKISIVLNALQFIFVACAPQNRNIFNAYPTRMLRGFHVLCVCLSAEFSPSLAQEKDIERMKIEDKCEVCESKCQNA